MQSQQTSGSANAVSHLVASSPVAVSTTRTRRLTWLLITKSVIDLALVSWLAVSYHYQTFNPYFRGSVDRADAVQIAGWVTNGAEPQERVTVQLYIDNCFVQASLADQPRHDVVAAGRAANAHHGFAFDTRPLLLTRGEHEARVYAVHTSDGGARRTLQIIGQPKRFMVTAEDDSGESESHRAN